MLDILTAAATAMTNAGITVYWPDELVLESDGTLSPPSDARFAILWPGDANPHRSWTPDAFSLSTFEISAGGESMGDCVTVRDSILGALNAVDFPRVRTQRPVAGGNPGNRVWIAAMLFRVVIGR